MTPRTETFWPSIKEVKSFQDEMTVEFPIGQGDLCLVKLEVHLLDVAKDYYLFRVVSALSKSDPASSFHSQRLETLGILAGAVAHDFNNILTGILGHATYLKTILPQAGPHVESLSAIEHGTRKGSSITQQILTFTKLDATTPLGPVVVRDIVDRTCSLLRRAIPHRIALESSYGDCDARILCSEAHLSQIVVNLVVNARDAINDNGTIAVKISIESDKAALERIFKGLDLSAAHYLVLAVSDTGHGISEDLIPRIFEPYFSTKKEKGTGLGLATVASIVKSLGGTVTVTSTVQKGTTISLYLPLLSSQPASTETSSDATRGLIRGDENILVVDDEYPVRNVLVVSLQHLGYKVDAAASGKEAIEIVSKDPSRHHLIITDMLMPGMTGEQLFFELKKINPDLRVLLISGYTSEESIRNVLAHGGVGFVPKPFTIEDLSKQVRASLAKETP